MCLPGGNRRVELAEFGGLPGMVGPVKAIEFAQHRRRSRSSLRFLQSGDEDFNAGSKDKGLLLMQRRLAASGQQQADKSQKNQAGIAGTTIAGHSRSSAAINIAAASNPV